MARFWLPKDDWRGGMKLKTVDTMAKERNETEKLRSGRRQDEKGDEERKKRNAIQNMIIFWLHSF